MTEQNEKNDGRSAEAHPISQQMISTTAAVAGHSFSEAECELMLEKVNKNLSHYEALRAINLDNGVPPALRFDPITPDAPPTPSTETKAVPLSDLSSADVPSNLEDLAFYPVTHLAQLIKNRQVSSVALTSMYLERLKRYGPILECVVTLTEDLAKTQAQRADDEIAAGHYRSPLHGIPWGAKDLLATQGIPTTWGAEPYKDQLFDTDAAVVQRLEAAGAVLVAKLTMGSLAWGDVWFGGKTKSPWNLEEGSSGSSAGSGAATAAGLVGFAIGTETHGSIISPSTRCGLSGLRPTFGRVSRSGAMALSWSMDKIGPMCRSVDDCALVFDAIRGPDGQDLTVVDRPFSWPPDIDLTKLRIGYVKSAFEKDYDHNDHDKRTLDQFRSLGTTLIPIELPAEYPLEAIGICLYVEAAAAFDTLTRSKQDALLTRQGKDGWPTKFRQARLIPAVEYIQANRVRTLLMQAMARLMTDVDLYLAPSFGDNLLLTNLTGHPAVVVPNGFADNGLPTSITFTGRNYDEATILAVAKAYQDATDFHIRHPSLTEA